MKYIIFFIIFAIKVFAQDVDIDVKVNKDLSTKFITFLEFTFASKNNKTFQEITNQNVSFGSNIDKNIKILNHDEIKIYLEYINQHDGFKDGKYYSADIIPMINGNAMFGIKPDKNETYPYDHVLHKKIEVGPKGFATEKFLLIANKDNSQLEFNEINFSYKVANYKSIFKKEVVNSHGKKKFSISKSVFDNNNTDDLEYIKKTTVFEY